MKATIVRNNVVCNIGLDSVVIFHWGAKGVSMIKVLKEISLSLQEANKTLGKKSHKKQIKLDKSNKCESRLLTPKRGCKCVVAVSYLITLFDFSFISGGVGQRNNTKNGGTSQSQNQVRYVLIHFMLALDKQAPPWM